MKVFYVMCLAVAATAMPTVKEDGVMEKFISTLRDCVETDTMLCLKEKAMKFTENLAVAKDFSVVDGIAFSKTGSPRSARSYDPLPDEPKARELQIEERIMDNVVDFLDSHALQLRMPKAFTEDNSIEEEG
ncbi:jg27463 [Pararge aegeria aegeria]|uniref:Jg27463 protein n=2 Tax=Pararge aegeria TaxID=116150 RepID=A0A8S4QTP6_9NEOP|nr:jg27463 [Pararge aegeria aegeria]